MSQSSSPMTVEVSPAAQAHLLVCLEGQDLNTAGVRLSVDKGGCGGLKYVNEIVEQAQESDLVQQHGELKVFVDPESVPYLKGMMLDVQTSSLSQVKLVYVNPNAQTTCGCGESFSTEEDEG